MSFVASLLSGVPAYVRVLDVVQYPNVVFTLASNCIVIIERALLTDNQLDRLLAKGGGRVPDQTDSGQSENTTASIQNIQPLAMVEPSLDLLLPATQLPTKVDIDSFITRPELDMLYHQYFRAVHPLAHVLHKPTFDRQFYRSCLSQDSSSTPTRSFTALVLALCFAAAVSLSMSQPQVQFQTTKTALVDRLKLASERALVAAQHMKSLKLETLQAFAIYLVNTLLTYA